MASARPSRLRNTRHSSDTTHEKEIEQRPKNGHKVGGTATGGGRKKKVYCVCKGPDTGTPMIMCNECREWYHFRCVNIDERDAEDIELYICPSCHEKTGLCTVMEYEGPEAIEIRPHPPSRSVTNAIPRKPSPSPPPTPPLEDDDLSHEDSGDEYVVENERDKKRLKGNRRVHIASNGDSDSDSEPELKLSPRHARLTPNSSIRRASLNVARSESPSLVSSQPHSRLIKRRQSVSTNGPPAKRKRSEASVPVDGKGVSQIDAARKYCLAKFEELFVGIFIKYGAGKPQVKDEQSKEDVSERKEKEEIQPVREAEEVKKVEELGDDRMLEDNAQPKTQADNNETSQTGENLPQEALTKEADESKPKQQRDDGSAELAAEQKALLEERARTYARELEEAVYETYAEPDKTGKLAVGAKYKERFRMLTFNLSQSDRVHLHNLIASPPSTLHDPSSLPTSSPVTPSPIFSDTSWRLPPQTLANMSSTELASEEAQKSIKEAEEEALRQAILRQRVGGVARAKMTHKGIQEVGEDLGGSLSSHSSLDVEQDEDNGTRKGGEKAREEDQRREREKLERIKVTTATRARSTSSVMPPPESPLTPVTPTTPHASWGAPPPIPRHARGSVPLNTHSIPGQGQSGRPLFLSTPSDTLSTYTSSAVPGDELNLSEFLNIDDELGIQEDVDESLTLAKEPEIPPVSDSAQVSASVQSPLVGQGQGERQTQQMPGLSPFASRAAHPELASRPSFDLNTLWTASPPSSTTTSPPGTSSSPGLHGQVEQGQGRQEAAALRVEEAEGELGLEELTGFEMGGGAEDKDFDMFLEEKDNSPPRTVDADSEGRTQSESTDRATPPSDALPETLSSLPIVWTGALSIPLDTSLSQALTHTVHLHARPIGGTPHLVPHDPRWGVLFPTGELRIDGRVPTEKSAAYLTGMRLNAGRDLVAVTFTANGEGDGMDILANYLINKGRHGLIFPWGPHPKDHHPGRELYIVPLLPSDPVPEFIELLDNLRFPKKRDQAVLVGIWVLSKGKLKEPPAMPTPVGGAMAHTPQPQVQGELPPNASAAALAAEVASLTPEQIQLMLQTLQANAALSNMPSSSSPMSVASSYPVIPPIPGASSVSSILNMQRATPILSSHQAIPPTLPLPIIPGLTPPRPPVQSWSAPSPTPGPGYSPYIPSVPYGGQVVYDGHGSPGRGGYGDNGMHPPSYDDQQHNDRDWDRSGGGGDWGHGDGRRGRSYSGRGWRGGDRDKGRERERDSGWRGRGRGRGSDGSSSRGRGRRGGSTQKWN